jgi:hypothetical protein
MGMPSTSAAVLTGQQTLMPWPPNNGSPYEELQLPARAAELLLMFM